MFYMCIHICTYMYMHIFLLFVSTNYLANLSEIPADRNHVAEFLHNTPPACMRNWRQPAASVDAA